MGIVCLDAVFRFMSLRVATDSAYVAGFGGAGVQAMVLLLMETQHYGYLIAQIFYSLWLVPLGYLAYTSGHVPQKHWRSPHRGRRRASMSRARG